MQNNAKTHILCSVTFSETGTSDKNCVQVCTDRQTIDSNVTRLRVVPYWIIKTTDTNCVQFRTDRQTTESNVTRRMVIPYWINKSTDTQTVYSFVPTDRP